MRRDRQAKAVAAVLPPGSALLAGERGGLPIPGFDLGNSPGEFTPKLCQGKTLIMTTTNGTRAILASLEAERVYIASFANLRATSDEIVLQFLKKDHGHAIHIVCSGTEGFISLEDSLASRGHSQERDRSDDPRLRRSDPRWAMTKRSSPSRSGSVRHRRIASVPCMGCSSWGGAVRNVERIGLAADIDLAAKVDRFPIVAELIRDPLRIVAVLDSRMPSASCPGLDGGVGPAKVMPLGEVTTCWTTWTSWSRSASDGGSSSRRARSTAASTASGITARSASS